MVRADLLPYLVDLVEAHLGDAPHLQAQEVFDRRAGVALQRLRHLLVIFVALGLAEMLARHLVMPQRGVPVAADILDRHLSRAVGALAEDRPSRRDRWQRLAAVHLLINGSILAELLRDGFPRFLRDNQD